MQRLHNQPGSAARSRAAGCTAHTPVYPHTPPTTYTGDVARKHTMPCADCGTIVVKRLRADRDTLCIDCACRRMARANEQMRAGQGEVHDRWIAGMIDAALRHVSQHPAS